MKNANFPTSHWFSIGTLTHEKHQIAKVTFILNWTLTHEKHKHSKVTLIFNWDINPGKTQTFQRHIDLQTGKLTNEKHKFLQSHIDLQLEH